MYKSTIITTIQLMVSIVRVLGVCFFSWLTLAEQTFGVDLEARARADRKRVPIIVTTILTFLDNRRRIPLDFFVVISTYFKMQIIQIWKVTRLVEAFGLWTSRLLQHITFATR